jgi:hypothetical protein
MTNREVIETGRAFQILADIEQLEWAVASQTFCLAVRSGFRRWGGDGRALSNGDGL